MASDVARPDADLLGVETAVARAVYRHRIAAWLFAIMLAVPVAGLAILIIKGRSDAMAMQQEKISSSESTRVTARLAQDVDTLIPQVRSLDAAIETARAVASEVEAVRTRLSGLEVTQRKIEGLVSATTAAVQPAGTSDAPLLLRNLDLLRRDQLTSNAAIASLTLASERQAAALQVVTAATDTLRSAITAAKPDAVTPDPRIAAQAARIAELERLLATLQAELQDLKIRAVQTEGRR